MRSLVCVMLSIGVVGCAGRSTPQLAPAQAEGAASRNVATAPGESLETFMAKVRQLAAQARPARSAAVTIEGRDPGLAAALVTASVRPGPETYRAVATEYHRLGVADRAHEYLNRALALNPQDPATYDSLARMWRDWGFPNLALGDAYRAVYYAPASPGARNTLGTVFQALGKRQLARVQYERALQLDPSAAYALNNLCYGWVLDGDGRRAAAACIRALELEPHLTAARNNLGLAYAAAGEVDAARAEFARSDSRAGALYNLGIVHLAHRRYSEAVRAFAAAHAAQPSLPLAAARVRQAEAMVRAGDTR